MSSRDQILALPHAQHPQLAALADQLSTRPNLDVTTATAILDAAARDLRISPLDIEMAQPEARVLAPFEANTQTTPGEAFNELVSHHVRQRLGVQR